VLTDILRAAGLRKSVVCGVSTVDAAARNAGGAVQVVELRGKAGERAAITGAAGRRQHVEVLRGPRNTLRINIPQPRTPVAEPRPLPPEPAPPPKKKEKTWVTFQVVEEGTGRLLRRVRLRIKKPDGNEDYYTTNGEGVIRIDPVDAGKCDVSCDLKDARLANTWHFVALESRAAPLEANGATDSSSTMSGIAEIEPHKVRSGETLDGLAKSVDMTWQQLAKFNWSTDVPDEINVHLRDAVGCRKKTASGKNYIFDDADSPGIVYLPKPWIRLDRDTTETHVIRVRRITRPLDVVIPLEMDVDDDPLQDDEVRLQSAERPWQRILLASDPDVVPDFKRRFLLYRFRAVPTGLYNVAVRVGGDWFDVYRGLRVKEDGVYSGKKRLPQVPASDKAAKPDEAPEIQDLECPDTGRIADFVEMG
jgi:hypothetical protein